VRAFDERRAGKNVNPGLIGSFIIADPKKTFSSSKSV
jgi:hypothetical protein